MGEKNIKKSKGVGKLGEGGRKNVYDLHFLIESRSS